MWSSAFSPSEAGTAAGQNSSEQITGICSGSNSHKGDSESQEVPAATQGLALLSHSVNFNLLTTCKATASLPVGLTQHLGTGELWETATEWTDTQKSSPLLQ